ncbi:MAG TPA: class II aldolase/adducin family protein [Actinomycetota bacterium]|nr:class II aldolase/adducin family protein [Actinomycetota bacterium]
MEAGDLAAFCEAGRALFSLGLVKGSEGNLSTWDGRRLVITRTGCELARLTEDDLLEGTLEDPPASASSDLGRHVAIYRSNGPGAVAHAHPPGSVPQGWAPGQEHGSYAFGATLDAAVAGIVRAARVAGRRAGGAP